MGKIIQIAVAGTIPVNSVRVAAVIYALDDQGHIFEKCQGCPWTSIDLPVSQQPHEHAAHDPKCALRNGGDACDCCLSK